jgi:hypothetical protein
MTEKIIETQILRWLNFQSQVFAFKINTVGVYDSKREVYRVNRNPFVIKGTADILAIMQTDFGGLFLAIEVKTPKTIKEFQNQTTERAINQKAFLDKIDQKGGFSICVSSLSDTIKWIEKLKVLINDYKIKMKINERLK